MENFTPVASTLGGAIIGLSAALLMLSHGRIAGISGILGGLLGRPLPGHFGWRLAFVLGLVAGGVALGSMYPAGVEVSVTRSPPALVLAGLAVGFGTRLGSGCTSGHGICGLSRLSGRSIAATLTFMAVGALTAAIVTHGLGGQL